jgi:hypothetical protein
LAEQQGGSPGGRIALDSGTPKWLIMGSAIIEFCFYSEHLKCGREEKSEESEIWGEEAPWVPVLSDRDLEYSTR